MNEPVFDPKSVAGKRWEATEHVQVLVVGGGRAGLTAAITAARRGLSVMLVDENPVSAAGMGDDVPLHYGQGMTAAVRNPNAMMEAVVASEPLIEEAFEAGVDVRLRTACWGLYGKGPGAGWLPDRVAGLCDPERSWLIGADHVIVAAGRRDMGIAFPGWEKPGVMGASAAVSLARRYGALAPQRVVVLGSSAEALLAAVALREAGVDVVALVEQAGEAVGPADWVDRLRTGGTEILCAHVVREAIGAERVESVLIAGVDAAGRSRGDERRIACDGVVLAVGATPVIDLLDALGCRVAFQPERGGYAPLVDGDQRTSVAGVFAIGDCAGIWPSKSAHPAVAEREARRAVAAILATAEEPGAPAESPIQPDAPAYDLSTYRLDWVRASVIEARAEVQVCQCEDVTARELIEVRPPRYLDWTAERRNDRSLAALLGEGPPHPDQVKRLTRAGMGPCQGRRCREQVAALLALSGAVPLSAVPLASYRAPVRPMPLALAGQLPEPPEQTEHWDTWFGMHAQYVPFWEVPARYTVATGRGTGPVASE